jgi:hypothetical protein
MPRKKFKPGGNIRDDRTYDPFPKSGFVKQYEPFIRKTVGEFCKKYPLLRREDLLAEAVRIALLVEQKFKPELGNDFSTFLRHGLRGLHRLAEQEASLRRVQVALLDGGFQKAQEDEEAREAKTPDGKFYPGANGTPLTLDFQWMENGKRKRAIVRVPLACWHRWSIRSRGTQPPLLPKRL